LNVLRVMICRVDYTKITFKAFFIATKALKELKALKENNEASKGE